MPEELFNVVQVFEDDSNEYVRRNVTAEEAVNAAKHYCNSVGARLGFTKKVMITDQLDHCNFLWEHGKGIVFPPEAVGRA